MNRERVLFRMITVMLTLIAAIPVTTACRTRAAAIRQVPKWAKFEQAFSSSMDYANPLQEAEMFATFRSPLGEELVVPGFWDGGGAWKVRFRPDQPGLWKWETKSSDTANPGLHGQKGSFLCTARAGSGRFLEHGPIRVHHGGRYLEHQDGTPFFYLGDTAWSGPLKSTDSDWAFYLETRAGQGFSAVQWVPTQFRAAPDGDILKRLAYSGTNGIAVNPEFFQRLDGKVSAMNRAGLLSVPVMLWAHGGGTNRPIDPGAILNEEDASRLARYMVARWQADDVLWVLPGDGDYRGAKADRWKRIGRAVFGQIAHAPVSLHPGGRMWPISEFRDEPWLGINGYQSGHNERDDNLKWMTSGDPAKDWRALPVRPSISLEAPYENHVGAAGGKPMDDFVVRRAHYWSLLNAPVAGVGYGGHGVWGWDDGSRPPVDHPTTGTPLHWRDALFMPGARQMRHLSRFFADIPFHRLAPKPALLARQPGLNEVTTWIAVAGSEANDVVIAYTPVQQTISVFPDSVPRGGTARWFDPRNGEFAPAIGVVSDRTVEFPAPGVGDWILVIRGARSGAWN